ncbi:MAG: LysR substrate-binding domain-containing protein [Pseudomonadota bacterium]
MNARTLEILAQIAASGSLAAASRVLNVAPSAVSRALSAAEAEIGVRLFNRSTRSLSLTEAGARYLTRTALIRAELDAARDAARDAAAAPSGRLRLTASVAFGTMCIIPHLPVLKARFPEILPELVLTDAMVDLPAEGIDLAIRLAPQIDGDVTRARLMPTRYHVVATPSYLAARPLTTPAGLTAHPACVFSLPGFRTAWRFRNQQGEIAEHPVTPGLVASNALALRAAALAGLGPALLADWLIGPDLRAARLVDIFPDHDVTATSFDTSAWFVYPTRAFLPAKTRAAMEVLGPEIRNAAIQHVQNPAPHSLAETHQTP